MITKFTKRQLLEQCGFESSEAKTILEYQKKLPILVESDFSTDFSVNSYVLWEQLGNPQGKFSNWIKRKLVNKRLKDSDVLQFSEGKDYITKSQKCDIANTGGFRELSTYHLTVDCAKSLSLMENTTYGDLSRHYFILMEKAVKKQVDWELIRNPLRDGYNKMKDALNAYMNRMIQKDADEWDYKIEANALNIIATGFSAQEIRLFVGCQDKVTRDSLTATYNEYLLKLQELNIVYLGMNMNRYDRYKMLKQSFDILFPNAVPIRDDVDIARIIKNKEKYLEETKEKVLYVA